ncbi:MAG: RNA polymerase sporulation sigma factor SigH [Eubacteriales bacterium]|jgi:RNA polymerase sporulation-specific sigma factor
MTDKQQRIDHDAVDADLAEKAQQGDKASLERLLAHYQGVVQRVARSYFLVGGDDEDIIQEGMIGLYKAVRDFSSEKQISFFAFAELCITRQILSAIKGATRKKHIPLNSYVSLNKPVYDGESKEIPLQDTVEGPLPDGDPEQLLLWKEEQARLDQWLRRLLTPLEYGVFSLYLDGGSYQEISQKLNKSPKSVEGALRRVKKKLAAGRVKTEER